MSTSERRLIRALRAGDEAAFESLLERYHASMIRLAMLYVPSRTDAEEVVQETWLVVLQGLHRFEGRSSLKTWIFRILTNRARTHGQRAGRTVPFGDVWEGDVQPDLPAVDPERFLPADHPQWPHHWASFPQSWAALPEARLLSQETLACIQQAVVALPTKLRQVITLRDIEGWTSSEVCHTLGITDTYQRVLLHRARCRVRRALEAYLDEG
ncbi:MAG: sigma-70 family RNA polymerase sigma factor [Chloroflexota bacterium]|nr:sigma-70 family RNA polymerase sigma factor [Chloroflexota bacterium]